MHLGRVGVTWHAFVAVRPPKVLATKGPYRFLRHPCYVGSMLWLAGTGCAALGWGGLVLCMPCWPYFVERIHRENRMLGRTHGF